MDSPAAEKQSKNEGSEPELQEETVSPVPEPVELKKKKKKKRSGKSKNKPTGFEEYYVDAPVTLAEFEEEKGLYDSSISLIRRLETAIQRYETKRRMNSERRHVFMQYLSYGGVKTGPKMFEGNDQRALEQLDADEIVIATAETWIPEDRLEKCYVDFETVAKGYLSCLAPRLFSLDSEQEVDMVTNTIKNFLNYILHHDVCPEYKDNILAARLVCDKANQQIWKTRQAQRDAPGNFNVACSTLFGGSFFGVYSGDQEWIKESDQPYILVGLPDNTARKVVKFALASAGSYEEASRFRDLANSNRLEATLVDENGFEVVEILPANSEVKDFYKEFAPDLNPVGKVRAKAWRDLELPSEEITENEVSDSEIKSSTAPQEFVFFIEDSLLKNFFVGMKVDAQVHELNCGIHYFDSVFAMYCEFYTVLPNDAMVGWKQPRDLRGVGSSGEAVKRSNEDLDDEGEE